MNDEEGKAIAGTLPEPTAPKSGTAWIVWGAILIAWGVFAILRGIAVFDPYAMVGILPLGFGVWLLVVGLNKRRAWLHR